MGGYSIYASSLDGSDKCVRLEAYMADEHGGKDGWKIEKCYVKDDSNREMLDIIAGKFFIAYAPIESEKFLSMPKELARKYEEKFKYPERFYKSLDGIEAKPYKPVSKGYGEIRVNLWGNPECLHNLSEQTIYGQECPKRYTR